ncbi:MAG: co-chaperone GroES [Bacteroidetes bacterium]|jgi:chaperonin GroES|nr:co-chaperone GroES [Bacteroidota bacterium]MDO9185501.1 co-chaperone GroES [Bacteroidia bacterium]MDP1746718.1 co-chaperone GroES [Bacteroidota bacterium]
MAKENTKASIKPVAGSQNRVVVEASAAEEKTKGGIIIPDTAKEKPQRGKVIAVSDIDEKGNKPSVKVGDTVLYGKYAGTEVQLEGKDYLIMRETDIFAIV